MFVMKRSVVVCEASTDAIAHGSGHATSGSHQIAPSSV
jgi:hypothetical protein